jgi:hypothetical protein
MTTRVLAVTTAQDQETGKWSVFSTRHLLFYFEGDSEDEVVAQATRAITAANVIRRKQRETRVSTGPLVSEPVRVSHLAARNTRRMELEVA